MDRATPHQYDALITLAICVVVPIAGTCAAIAWIGLSLLLHDRVVDAVNGR